ncbi:MAG: DUF4383 domain-containing protein [Lyngbya sp.]|nr:DUF4383 domain-containing protein [Lyngbya sp.]
MNNMAERYCALALGIVFLVLGFAGFIPGLVTIPAANAPNDLYSASPGIYATGFGHVFGLFATNILHDLVHLAVGIVGIGAYINSKSARLFNRSFAVAYILLAVMGLLPLAKTTFGLMPIFGNNVWLNGVTGLIAGYFGFVNPTIAPETASNQNI